MTTSTDYKALAKEALEALTGNYVIRIGRRHEHYTEEIDPSSVREIVVNVEELARAVLDLSDKLDEAMEVVEFYGDPMTWFATTLLRDEPCGDIADDYGEATREEDGVTKMFLGAKARALLAKLKGEG